MIEDFEPDEELREAARQAIANDELQHPDQDQSLPADVPIGNPEGEP